MTEEARTVVYVTVRLEIKAGEDPHNVVDELDYDFDHPAILSTVITEAEQKDI